VPPCFADMARPSIAARQGRESNQGKRVASHCAACSTGDEAPCQILIRPYFAFSPCLTCRDPRAQLARDEIAWTYISARNGRSSRAHNTQPRW
jgi:hypothetical protein